MKENVDLTTNRDFRIKSKEAQSVYQEFIFGRRINLNKSFHTHDRFGVLDDDVYIDDDSGGIRQGNADKRRSKLLYGEFGLGNFCDCCGLELKPYYNNNLCTTCDNRLEERVLNIF